MQSQITPLLVLLLGLALSSGPSRAHKERGDKGDELRAVTKTERGHSVLPKLFNFSQFKRKFNKRYKSLVEEMQRQKLYSARLARSAESMMRYKLLLADSFARVNHLSDWTGVERRRLVATRDQGQAQRWNTFKHLNFETTPEFEAVIEQQAKEARGAAGGRVDLRETGCIEPVRDQGNCQDCYIFSFITMLEYLFCISMDKSARFSEQYVLDCGRPFGLEACEGGTFSGLVKFLGIMGVEPLQIFGYVGKKLACPYAINGDPNKLNSRRAGYAKLKREPKIGLVKYKDWERSLSNEIPLDVDILVDEEEFEDYGGGIHLGSESCSFHHAMLLIGSGREDGKNYWLLRNSFGPDWGLSGYYKLNEGSKCIGQARYGLTLSAFKRADEERVFEPNPHYNRSIIASRPPGG